MCAAPSGERTPPWTRALGVGLLLGLGLVAALGAWQLPHLLRATHGEWGATAGRSTAWSTLLDIPATTWLGFRTMLAAAGIALIFFPAMALWFLPQNRERIALTAIAAAMVPIGFAMIDGVARVAPYFSLADAATFINERVAPNDKIIYEGHLHTGSSLVFYLGRKFYLVSQDPAAEPGMALMPDADIYLDEPTVVTAWSGADRLVLLGERERLAQGRAGSGDHGDAAAALTPRERPRRKRPRPSCASNGRIRSAVPST